MPARPSHPTQFATTRWTLIREAARGGDTEAVDADYLEMAQGWLTAGGFDAIVSTDGDGDRPLLIDHMGRQVLGHALRGRVRTVGRKGVMGSWSDPAQIRVV